MGGFTYQQYLGTSFGASGTDFISDAPEAWGLGAAANFWNAFLRLYQMGINVIFG